MKKQNSNNGPTFLMDKLAEYAMLEQAQVLSNLGTSQSGLDAQEAARRLGAYGLN